MLAIRRVLVVALLAMALFVSGPIRCEAAADLPLIQAQSGQKSAKTKAKKAKAPPKKDGARPGEPKGEKGVKGSAKSADESRLDALLTMLGGRGYLNEEGLPITPNAEWIARVGRMRESRQPAVAAAANAAAATGLHRAAELKLRAAANESNKQLVEDGLDRLKRQDWTWIFEGPTGNHNRLVEEGVITSETAQAIKEARAERELDLAEAITPFARALGSSYLTNLSIRNLRRQCDALQADIVRTRLAPALAARAGEKTETPPIDVKFGSGGWRDVWTEGYLTAVSRADKPLTRVTLLIELKVGSRTQLGAWYFPRWEPGVRFRALPLVSTNQVLKDTKLERSRYSLWCDQLAVEGGTVTDQSREAAMVDYASQASQPGMAYLTTDEYREKKPRYGLTFTKLTPSGATSRVEARLARFGAEDLSKPLAQTTYSGTAEAGPRDRLPEVKYSLRSGKDELGLHLTIGSEGELTWNVITNQLGGHRRIVPADQLRKKEADHAERMVVIGQMSAKLDEARRLALDGKRDEAERKLREFIASKPEEHWAERAQRQIEMLDELVKVGKRLYKK